MAYEAQISGLPDRIPFDSGISFAATVLKIFSRPDVISKRAAVLSFLHEQRHELEFFNGGGTGSMQFTSNDASVTEVAAGSGLLQASIFDNFWANQCRSAFTFALRCTRTSQNGKIITCQSGGFIASGQIHQDKAPQLLLPTNLSTLPNEGMGEVQTPLTVARHKDNAVRIGDPVFFRPAKAGEIAERFREYIIIDQANGSVIRVPTYRGLQQAFF
eukprot:m.113183 g.113183  ORF g.113183 m.113183 type:complete len:216 (+) comp22866_c0_seq2:871-1518(+)